MREVLAGLLWSQSCKIPDAWRNEILYAIKHAPSPFDVEIEGARVDLNVSQEIEAFAGWVSELDAKSKAKRKGALEK
jgi:hypothetical protein